MQVINATSKSLQVRVAGSELRLSSMTVGSYRIVARNSLKVQANARELSFPIKPKTFYSLAFTPGKTPPVATLLEDGQTFPRTKAALTVYNLSDARSVTVRTLDGGGTVAQNLAPLQKINRLVNGVAVDLRASADNRTVGTLKNVQFQIGLAYSILVMGTRGQYTVKFVPSTTSAAPAP